MSADPLLGEIIMFAGNFAPRGWAFCDGQLLAISQNDALFSLLGTMYGGDGRTTFALPDLRGRVPISAGEGPGLTNYYQGAKGGSEVHNLDVSNLPSHIHSISPTSNNLGSSSSSTADLKVHNGTGDTNDPSKAKSIASQIAINRDTYNLLSTTNPSTKITDAVTDISAGGSGGGTTVPTQTNSTGDNRSVYHMPPFSTIRFIIATEGVYPPRS